MAGPAAPGLAPCLRAARPEPPQRPLQRLAGQHVRPAGTGHGQGAAQQGQRLLEVVPGLAHLAQLHVRLGQQAVPVGPLGRRDVAAAQCGPEGGLRLPEPAAAPVELPQPGEVAVQLRRVGLLDQPVGSGPEVLHVGVERGDVREGLARVGQQACEVGGVTPAHLGLLGRVGGQPLGGVLAQQLVHAVAPVLAHLDQGVVDQAGQQGQPGAGHGGGRVQVEAAPHDRQAGQGLALAVAEQLPGPVEHRGHAAVARLHVGRGRGQQLAAGGQAVGDGRRGGGADPAGGQLDGQRHPGHQPVDPPDGGQVGGRPQPGPEQPGPVLEQPLDPEAQPPPRGPEDLHPGRPAEQLRQHPAASRSCSRLSRTSSSSRPARTSASSSRGSRGTASDTPRAAARLVTTRSAASSGRAGLVPANDTVTTPSRCRPRLVAPASRASRVLPIPPGPTSVTSRHAGSSSNACSRVRSPSRPISDVSGPGATGAPDPTPVAPDPDAAVPDPDPGGRSVNPPAWAIWSRRVVVAGDGS